jgi:hypothetical protein
MTFFNNVSLVTTSKRRTVPWVNGQQRVTAHVSKRPVQPTGTTTATIHRRRRSSSCVSLVVPSSCAAVMTLLCTTASLPLFLRRYYQQPHTSSEQQQPYNYTTYLHEAISDPLQGYRPVVTTGWDTVQYGTTFIPKVNVES